MSTVRLTAGAFALALAILVSGFSAPISAQEYYADIRPVLVESCMSCHIDEGVGWSMEDPEGTYERRHSIAHMVTSRNMPPWQADSHVQEYVGDISLEEDVVAVFAEWQDANFPRGEPRPDPNLRPEPEGAFTADLSLAPLGGEAYTPDPSMTDDYRCFMVEWPLEEPAYVTGFSLVPGNPRLAHHSVFFVVEPALVDRYRELDEEEEGPGFECFNFLGIPDRLLYEADERAAYEARYPGGIQELLDGNSVLMTWATGMWGNVFPEGTGIRVEPGSALAVQMHYFTGHAPGEADAGSKLHLQIAERVERPAFFVSQTREGWLPPLDPDQIPSLVIPPGETLTYEVTNNFDGLPSIDFDGLRSIAAGRTGVDADRIEALEVHSAHLHMHAFGQSGDISFVDPDGRSETLLSVPRFDFNWERHFFLTEPKVVPRDEMAATSLRLRCIFHNDTEETVYGGWGSSDEMCFNNSYISVRAYSPDTESTDSSPAHPRKP